MMMQMHHHRTSFRGSESHSNAPTAGDDAPPVPDPRGEFSHCGMCRSVFMATKGAAHLVGAEPCDLEAPGRSIDATLRQNDALLRRIAELESELLAAQASGARGDRLTGLVGREVLIDRLDHCMARSARTSEHYAVLYCDLDGFKLVNDVFGHEAGDAVLVEVAKRLQQGVRAYDTVARFGGDEFVILLEDINDTPDALAIAQRIVTSISETIALPGAQATIGISIGVAKGLGAAECLEAILARADAAMYEAKRSGKGRVEVFGQDLDRRLTDRRELGNDLRFAIDRNELELWYRPVISLDTGCITSLEGSVRWDHPSRGLLTPEAFVPIAYTTGMIEQVDLWVLTTAATDATLWRREHPALVAWITISTRLLMRDDGPQQIQKILSGVGAEAHSIGIELAEDAVVHNFSDTVSALRELQSANVCIALDNFCGELTVPQLHSLRPDTVKLDRSFLTRLGADVEAATAIRSITGMIRPLGITIVAKGVNTQEQLAAVISLNCDAAQGSISGQPTRSTDIEFARCRLESDNPATGGGSTTLNL